MSLSEPGVSLIFAPEPRARALSIRSASDEAVSNRFYGPLDPFRLCPLVRGCPPTASSIRSIHDASQSTGVDIHSWTTEGPASSLSREAGDTCVPSVTKRSNSLCDRLVSTNVHSVAGTVLPVGRLQRCLPARSSVCPRTRSLITADEDSVVTCGPPCGAGGATDACAVCAASLFGNLTKIVAQFYLKL